MKTLSRPGAGLARLAARGFTLIELLITIAILGILLGIAAPSFNEAILSNRLAGYANTFVAGASVARSEAIKRNFSITMCRSADGATCATSGKRSSPIAPLVFVKKAKNFPITASRQRLNG